MVLLELTLLTGASLAACPFKEMMPQEGVQGHMPPPIVKSAIEWAYPWSEAADPATQTFKGCKCKSACGASIDIGSSSCDWCYTEGNCGHFSLTRFQHFDYCAYRTETNWESKTAHDKFQETWHKVALDQTPGHYPSIDFGEIFIESVQTTFDNQWDYMPVGRKKMIHSVGMVCPVDFKVTSDKYTGVFEQGTQTAFLRLGSALPVTGVTGVVPGIGMKFFRTGTHSANYVTLHSLGAVMDYDMFKQPQWNHIDNGPAFAAPLAEKFKQASQCPTQVGLSDSCSWTQDGKKVENPVFPFKIEYRPTGEATMPSTPQFSHDLLHNMIKGAPKGSRIYDVYAWETPASEPELMATITVAQTCVSSKYGDEKMFFQHQRIEEDWQIKPEWMASLNPMEDCGRVRGELTTTPPKPCSEFTGQQGPCYE